MQLFYHPNLTNTSKEIIFSKEESRHLVKVLRKKEGDLITTTNGNGYFFNVELDFADAKKATGHIISAKKQEPLPYSLHLAVAPTKLNERFEWFLEKATEIGVSEITPLLCQRSERKVIKPERYERIIISAMKQSVKAYKPKLNLITAFTDFIKLETVKKDTNKYIAHCEADDDKITLKSALKPQKELLILIGPEGDFSPQEIVFAKQHNFKPVSLSTSRLRTETAAIVACHSVAFVNE